MGAGGLHMTASGPEPGTVRWWVRKPDGTMTPGWVVSEHDVGKEGGLPQGKVMRVLFGFQLSLFDRGEVWVSQYDLLGLVDGEYVTSLVVRAHVRQDSDVVIDCWPKRAA